MTDLRGGAVMGEQGGHAAENTAKPEHLIIRDPHGEHGPVSWCICGWRKSHARGKVREAAVARHLARVTPPGSSHESAESGEGRDRG